MVQRIVQNYKVSFSGLSRETWLLSMVILINRCGYMAVPFMSMYITQSLHRSIADAGIIITLFGVGGVLGAMAGGYLTDKIGFKTVQIVSLVVSGLLFLLFSYITNFYHLCVLTIILSFFVEGFKPANNTAVASYASPQTLTRSYALNRLAQNLGFGFGTSIGGLLAAINYKLLFWVDGVVYILAGIFILFLLPKTGNLIVKKKIEQAGDMPELSPWRDPFFLRLIFLFTLFMMSFVLMFRLVPVYWKEQLHIGESTIGILLGMNGVIIALFEMVLIQNLAGRKPDTSYIVAGVFISAVAYLFLVFADVGPVVIAAVAVVFITVGEMLTLPYISTMIMGRATESNRGKYSAAYSLSWAVAQIVGPGSGGYIAARWGYNMLWLVLVIFCAVTAVGFKLLFQSLAPRAGKV